MTKARVSGQFLETLILRTPPTLTVTANYAAVTEQIMETLMVPSVGAQVSEQVLEVLMVETGTSPQAAPPASYPLVID